VVKRLWEACVPTTRLAQVAVVPQVATKPPGSVCVLSLRRVQCWVGCAAVAALPLRQWRCAICGPCCSLHGRLLAVRVLVKHMPGMRLRMSGQVSASRTGSYIEHLLWLLTVALLLGVC